MVVARAYDNETGTRCDVMIMKRTMVMVMIINKKACKRAIDGNAAGFFVSPLLSCATNNEIRRDLHLMLDMQGVVQLCRGS